MARKGRETVIQLAARHEVRPRQIQTWYKALAVAEDAPGQERNITNKAELAAQFHQEVCWSKDVICGPCTRHLPKEISPIPILPCMPKGGMSEFEIANLGTRGPSSVKRN